MNDLERTVLRDLLIEEFSRHRSTSRGPDETRWVCKCGADVPTDERGYPLGRHHIIERFLDKLDEAGVTTR